MLIPKRNWVGQVNAGEAKQCIIPSFATGFAFTTHLSLPQEQDAQKSCGDTQLCQHCCSCPGFRSRHGGCKAYLEVLCWRRETPHQMSPMSINKNLILISPFLVAPESIESPATDHMNETMTKRQPWWPSATCTLPYLVRHRAGILQDNFYFARCIQTILNFFSAFLKSFISRFFFCLTQGHLKAVSMVPCVQQSSGAGDM